MSTMLLTQQILNGLLDGVYYLLIALGLSLIFSLGGIVNLAHGAFYAIGAYLTLVLSPYLGFGGSFVAAPVVGALLGVVIERTLFRRFYRSDPILSLLMTFGLAMVAEQALRMIFGAPPLSYSIPQWLRGQVAIGSFIYSFYRMVLLGIAATCIAGLWVLLQKTSFGRVVRAGVQNPDMVGALGISLQPYMSAVAALGIGLAGLAGVLLAPIYAVHPAMGQEIITPAFVVVVIGGLGSFWGVVAAALLVGLVKGVMVGIGYSAASTAAIYLLMLLVLLFRPRGLFGERIMWFEWSIKLRRRRPIPLLFAALGIFVLPPVLLSLGLTMTSATEVVTYALACMALNILVGHTGLVSFGHGAWFGLAAYAAALLQRNWMHDSFFGPTLVGVLSVTVIAAAFGFLILRRRGVYFSLLTLALAAMLYAVSFRWTEVTGGENGLGGITRPTLFGF